jgi:hypothetical protein
MIMSEVSKILAVLTAAYLNFGINEAKLQLWNELLMDVPYPLAQAAIKKYICESPNPPTIADIRGVVANIMYYKEDEVDARDAWGEVMRCVSAYGSYNPEEAIEGMSRKTAEAAKKIGWREICLSENTSAVKDKFIRIYEDLEERERRERMLPEGLRLEIEGFEWNALTKS